MISIRQGSYNIQFQRRGLRLFLNISIIQKIVN